MVQFGQKLIALANAPWKEHYLDYNRLKRMLRHDPDLVSDDDSNSDGSNHSYHQPQLLQQDDNDDIDYLERDGFVALLNREIVKCVLFFLHQQGELAAQLRQVYQPQQRQLAWQVWEWHDCCYCGNWQSHHSNENNNDNDIDEDEDEEEDDQLLQHHQQRRLELLTQLQELAVMLRNTVGQDLWQLVRYAELTLTAVRKILKKHDKLQRRRQQRTTSRYNNNSNPYASTNRSTTLLMGQYFSPGSSSSHHNNYWNNIHNSISGSSTRTATNAAATVEAHLRQLQHLEGVGALVATLKQSFAELQRLEQILWTGRVVETASSTALVSSGPWYFPWSVLGSSSSSSPQSEPDVTTTQTKKHPRPPRRIPSAPEISAVTTTTTTTTLVGVTPEKEHNDDDEAAAAAATLTATPSNSLPRPTANLRSSSEHYRHHHRAIHTQQQTQPPTSIFFVIEPVLLKIEAAQQRLKETSQLVQLLAAPVLMLERTPELVDDNDADDFTRTAPLLQLALDDLQQQQQQQESTTLRRHERWRSNALNLCSAFLFLTNYYIAAPTAGEYAAQLVWVAEAIATNSTTTPTPSATAATHAGLVMGMTPLAALGSTLFYSWWTTVHTYRSAFLVAAGLAAGGNLLYALAGPVGGHSKHHSRTWMLLLGRCLVGLGSCRAINRRYIADAYPVHERTAASAWFVVAGSLGMAVGPALAALISIVLVPPNSEIHHQHHHSSSSSNKAWWSVGNTPGWIMFFLWVVYFILVCLYFRDPPPRSNRQNINNNNNKTASQEVVASSDAATGNEPVGTSETTPLLAMPLAHNGDGTARESTRNNDGDLPIWKNIPVLATILFVFVLKMTLECCLSSTATLTSYYFDWDARQTGIFLALLALLVLPANSVLVMMAGRHTEDRHILRATLFGMMVGVWGIRQYHFPFWSSSSSGGEDSPAEYSVAQYITFTVIAFVATNALEGPNMSLLSKSIPQRWACGFWNMGLLATETGNLGRTAGDVLLAWCGRSSVGMDGLLLNRLFGTLGWIVTLTWITACVTFSQLEPPIDLDD